MRKVTYETFWTFGRRGTKREGTLLDLVLDIPYLMADTGIIPSFAALNEILKGGGNSGGMSPGTKWHPFKISQAEYRELVEMLLSLDLPVERSKHPYLLCTKIAVAEESENPVKSDQQDSAIARA